MTVPSILFFFFPHLITFSPSYCLYLIVVGRKGEGFGTVIFTSSCAFGESGRVKVPSWGVSCVGRRGRRLQALLDSIQPAMDCTIVMKSRGNKDHVGFMGCDELMSLIWHLIGRV